MCQVVYFYTSWPVFHCFWKFRVAVDRLFLFLIVYFFQYVWMLQSSYRSILLSVWNLLVKSIADSLSQCVHFNWCLFLVGEWVTSALKVTLWDVGFVCCATLLQVRHSNWLIRRGSYRNSSFSNVCACVDFLVCKIKVLVINTTLFRSSSGYLFALTSWNVVRIIT